VSDPEAIAAQMAAYEKQQIAAHESRIHAVVGPAKGSIGELERVLERYDEACASRPHDEEARFAMEELWKVLAHGSICLYLVTLCRIGRSWKPFSRGYPPHGDGGRGGMPLAHPSKSRLAPALTPAHVLRHQVR